MKKPRFELRPAEERLEKGAVGWWDLFIDNLWMGVAWNEDDVEYRKIRAMVALANETVESVERMEDQLDEKTNKV